jgi:hypothetical protein
MTGSRRSRRARADLFSCLLALAILGAATHASMGAAPGLQAPIGAASGPGAPGAAEPSEDIRDIRGPKSMASTWIVSGLMAGAALLAAAYLTWRWRRARPQTRVPLPFEVALDRLEEIRTLMTPAGSRAFCVAASDIVRNYIQQRFSIIATQRTTEEFLQDLVRAPRVSLARHQGLLAEFLQRCDYVKFAGAAIETEDMEFLYRSARDFVTETASEEVSVADRGAHDSLPAT